MNITMRELLQDSMFSKFHCPSLRVGGDQSLQLRIAARFQAQVGTAIRHDTKANLAASLVGLSYAEVRYMDTVLGDCVFEESWKELVAVASELGLQVR